MFSLMINKILYGLLIITLVIVTVSSIIYLAPVDPTRLTFGQMADAGSVEKKQKELGLDKPLIVQLGYYLNDISPISIYQKDYLTHPPFGHWFKLLSLGKYKIIGKLPYLRESFQTGRQVSQLLLEALPKTMLLASLSLLFALLIGIPFGIICALHRNSIVDKLIIAFSTLGISLPSYIPAILFAVLFGFILTNITGLDVQGSLFEMNDLGESELRLRNLILPVLALGIRPIAMIAQLTRSAFLDIFNQEYIKTAKAKGVNTFNMVLKHALPNASITIIAASSGWFATLIAGSYFVETIFNFKGMGDLTVNALLSFDIPVLLGALICICTIFIFINIVVDMLYIKADPRIK